ncbi:hypothetical protein HYDPIDRAFT_84671 [Hydnomerulius pinastri MD-312]|nr:hypothetical protein HYDPIDRAFT_84671 [Hydnomerulius pinastri MD-312]
MSHSLTTAYIRVASTSIAAYDYLRTFPTAYRFYATQWNNANIRSSGKLTTSSIMSISVLTLSNIGFFYSKFTAESCSRFYLLPAIFKGTVLNLFGSYIVLQIMVSQCIMAVRTYNLSRRSTSIGFLVIVAYFVACGVCSIVHYLCRSDEKAKDAMVFKSCPPCLATLVDGHHIGGWFYYVVSIVYDLIMTLISVYYLLKYKLTLSNTST